MKKVIIVEEFDGLNVSAEYIVYENVTVRCAMDWLEHLGFDRAQKRAGKLCYFYNLTDCYGSNINVQIIDAYPEVVALYPHRSISEFEKSVREWN